MKAFKLWCDLTAHFTTGERVVTGSGRCFGCTVEGKLYTCVDGKGKYSVDLCYVCWRSCGIYRDNGVVNDQFMSEYPAAIDTALKNDKIIAIQLAICNKMYTTREDCGTRCDMCFIRTEDRNHVDKYDLCVKCYRALAKTRNDIIVKKMLVDEYMGQDESSAGVSLLIAYLQIIV